MNNQDITLFFNKPFFCDNSCLSRVVSTNIHVYYSRPVAAQTLSTWAGPHTHGPVAYTHAHVQRRNQLRLFPHKTNDTRPPSAQICGIQPSARCPFTARAVSVCVCGTYSYLCVCTVCVRPKVYSKSSWSSLACMGPPRPAIPPPPLQSHTAGLGRGSGERESGECSYDRKSEQWE